MVETIAVGLIVVVAFLLTARSLYRSLTGKAPRCDCGQRGVCPLDDASGKEQCDSGADDGSQSRFCDDPS